MAAELVFAQEPFCALRSELEPLFRCHWEEVALNQDTVPLDPDWATYAELERRGLYSFTTARGDGFLVGYVGFIISRALHYRTLLCAEPDLLWLAPEERLGSAGFRLLKAAEAAVIALGVKRIGGRCKLHKDLGMLFDRAGYRPIERSYAKMVG